MTEMTGKLIAGSSPSQRERGITEKPFVIVFFYSPKKTLSLLDDEF